MNYYFIPLLIITISFCLTYYSYEKFTTKRMKVAIAIMTMKPVNFEVWLKYHLKYLKFDHIYIRVEDTPELKDIINKYPDKITAKFVSKQNNKNSYFNQMSRQDILINDSIQDCKKRNIKYLLHIDDDELFFINKKYKRSSDFFESLDNSYDQVHFTN